MAGEEKTAAKKLEKALESDKTLAGLDKLIAEEKAGYRELGKAADAVGGDMVKSLQGVAAAPVDAATAGDIRATLTAGKDAIEDRARAVTETLNRKAGIGLKAAEPPEDNRIDGIVKAARTAATDAARKAALREPVRTFARGTVDRYAKENARFQKAAGLKPVIRRESGANCCDWCAALEGEYEYGKEPRDVYRRHAHCRCDVLFEPHRGDRVQDVWSKKEYSNAEQLRESRARERESRKQERISEAEKQDWQKLLQEKVETGEYSLKLSHQKYLKHVEGTVQYKRYAEDMGQNPSRLTITEDEAQRIIYEYAGTGEPRKNGKGIPNVEYITADKIAGEWERLDGEWIETRRVAIHYGRENSHIVPVKELEA